ncbi:MAG: 4Fe-4S binding protein, partial [Acidobacteria bacterium]|nr:4Fe-4S binding protein [Acidobacteriota bacterium]
TPHEPRLLDECEACRICEALCPTGAVAGSCR